MKSNHSSTPSPDATTTFQRDLRELLLSAFGSGAAVEDVWTVDAPVSGAPSWRVTIEKLPPEDDSYEPTFLEE